MAKRLIVLLIAVSVMATTAWAGSLSDAYEVDVLDHIFGGSSLTQPANLYVDMCTDTPTDASACTAASCGIGNRKVFNDWTAAASGAISNNTAIVFDAPSGSCTLTHFEIWDTSSGGTRVGWGALAGSVVLINGDAAPQFNANDLDVTLD